MQDVRVDDEGNLRCWNCGGRHFLNKRTGKAHIIGYVTVGIGALATKKKLKCQTCNEFNQVGDAKPYTGPAGRKYRKQDQKAQPKPTRPTSQVFIPQGTTPTLPPPSPSEIVTTPAGWYPDPTGTATHRYWDGTAWTDHTN